MTNFVTKEFLADIVGEALGRERKRTDDAIAAGPRSRNDTLFKSTLYKEAEAARACLLGYTDAYLHMKAHAAKSGDPLPRVIKGVMPDD